MSDTFPQLFWFDSSGAPVAAAVVTVWPTWVSLDPIVVPGCEPEFTKLVLARGISHAAALGFDDVVVRAASDDEVLREALISVGRASVVPGSSDTALWLAVENRQPVTGLRVPYRLLDRVGAGDRPHHMIARSGAHVGSRLAQLSLYREDLDLCVTDGDSVAAYALFWFDPVTSTGVVEPVRTEDTHQGNGLARHLLTVGVERLAALGATRVKICHADNNPTAAHLYRSVGFEPAQNTAAYTRSATT